MNPFVFPILISMLITLAVTPWVRSFAIRRKIGDYPSARKIHSSFIPRLGGVGIIAGFCGGVLSALLLFPGLSDLLPFDLRAVALALAMIAGVGIYDDFRGIGSIGKLVVQFLAASVVIAAGLRIEHFTFPLIDPIPLGILSVPITLLWLVGVTNAVNLLDGLDGLASGVAAIVAFTMAGMASQLGDTVLVLFSLCLASACVGFLRYNFHPATIFMGDTGSLFLGFLLACLGLRVLTHSTVEAPAGSLMVVVAALFVPIVDTSVAFFRRLRKGMHPMKPDKEHIHHRLMDLGLTHRQTVIVIYAISAFNGLVAYLLIELNAFYGSILLLIVFSSTYLSIRRLGYVEEMKARRGSAAPVIRPLSVARIIDRSVLIAGDVLAIVSAFMLSYWFRFGAGLFSHVPYVPLAAYLVNPVVLLLTLTWLLLFWLGGLYEVPWDLSRIDYTILIFRLGVIGTLFFFMFTLDLSSITIEGRLTTLFYGASVIFFITLVRMFIVSVERRHEILGFRRRNTLVVGATKLSEDLLHEIAHRPSLKYNVVGFVDQDPAKHEFLGFPILGTHESIPDVVKREGIEEVLVATHYDAREEILDIVARCDGVVPAVKVMPLSSGILSGFRTEEIIGHPLVRLYPTNLKTWQRFIKRSVDLAVSFFVLIPFFPLWFLLGVLTKLDSSGPVFFIQERVGRRGKLFPLYKFRSMIEDAERETGPVWAAHDDKRITRVGRLLRKLRLDEVPQFINVLKGEMSLVGPRPERPFFVEQLKKDVRFYSRRLLVRPGITGWAQVKHRYDTSLEDVKVKIQYDLYYLENMSLTLDLKILIRTVFVALSGKGTH